MNDETISSNRFSIAQNKNQFNVVKKKLTAAPSDISTKQNIFKTVILLVTTSIINAIKVVYHLKSNNRGTNKSKRLI